MHHLLPEIRPPYQPVPGWAPALDRALKCLDRLASAAKEQLVEALVKTIALDQQLTVEESELLRVVCASISLSAATADESAGLAPGHLSSQGCPLRGDSQLACHLKESAPRARNSTAVIAR